MSKLKVNEWHLHLPSIQLVRFCHQWACMLLLLFMRQPCIRLVCLQLGERTCNLLLVYYSSGCRAEYPRSFATEVFGRKDIFEQNLLVYFSRQPLFQYANS